MKAKKVFEKFTEDSDPITDMGIGKINFKKEFNKQYLIPANKIFEKWVEYIDEFKGKKISGIFEFYPRGSYSVKKKYGEVSFDSVVLDHKEMLKMRDNHEKYITLTNDGTINIGSPEGTYCVIEGESYKISKMKKDE